jgi:hypothetical protein
MSHSVPSESSTGEAAFLVGADLVRFDRPDLPIYAPLDSRWAEAGHDVATFGSALDRLFGEPSEMFLSEHFVVPETPAAALVADDPLVVLSGLSDGLILPALEHEPAPVQGALAVPEIAAIYDFTDAHLHDLWTFYSHS